MRLSSNQIFILALAALAVVAAFAFLDHTYVPVVVTIALTILGVGGAQHASASGAAHILQGLNTGIPLSQMPAPLPLPTVEHVPSLPPMQSEVSNHAQVPG